MGSSLDILPPDITLIPVDKLSSLPVLPNALLPAPVDIPKKVFLPNQYFVLPGGLVFTDRKIPEAFDKPFKLPLDVSFSTHYFVNLHDLVQSFGTYNFSGARLRLEHSLINVDLFRKLIPRDYDDLSIFQYLEFGFPLGLAADFELCPVLKNHSSSYEYFSHIDNFISNELVFSGLTGPFCSSPFETVMTSPLMTATKKPSSRRAVFDASFSNFSLNMSTPERSYLGEDYEFSFPKIDDFAALILKLGRGCYMWKRDLSQFFLQLPLDPFDYDKVGFIWRGKLWFFTSYVWGCRHAGMNGQRVSTAVSTIHRLLGQSSYCIHKVVGCVDNCPHLSLNDDAAQLEPFNVLNYSDDFAGAEVKIGRADLSYKTLGSLLHELNILESFKKAVRQ